MKWLHMFATFKDVYSDYMKWNVIYFNIKKW